jgi:hypothetical protein
MQHDARSEWALPTGRNLVHIKGVDLTPSDLDRFLKHASCGPTYDCWLWDGLKNKTGYGICYISAPHLKGRKTLPVLATRLSWVLANRKDIPDGHLICHHCDNPQCINPRHLYAGTHKDNTRDAIQRGRMTQMGRFVHGPKARGEASGRSKLTTVQVLEIKTRWAAGGVLKKTLAAEFGVDKTQIAGILNGRVWRHVQIDSGLHNVSTATAPS